MNHLYQWVKNVLVIVSLGVFISGILFYQRSFEVIEVQPKLRVGQYQFAGPSIAKQKITLESITNPFIEFTMESATMDLSMASSHLILKGTLLGQNARAILAERDQPDNTRIVRPGEMVFGEKLVRVGRGYVVLLVGNGEVRLEQERM